MQLVPLDMYRYALENAIEIARCLHVNCYGCTAINCMSCENKKCNHCLVLKMEVFLPVVYASTVVTDAKVLCFLMALGGVVMFSHGAEPPPVIHSKVTMVL